VATKKERKDVMWVLVLLFLMVTTLGFIIMYKLIEIIPKVNKITASILALILTGVFTYEWLKNITSNLFTPMP
jgi:hypothetical protein